jgi:HemK-related putative methylase
MCATDKSDKKPPLQFEIQEEADIHLHVQNDVWSPYSAPQLITIIKQDNLTQYIKKRKVADIGCGTGILGIWMARYGASKVVMTDMSNEAVKLAKKNTILNKVQKNCHVVQSDRFKNLSQQKFDTILSNPPVQPWLFTGKDKLHRADASTWNEAGANGRLVLDSLIIESKKYLNKGGNLIFTHSSRHGIEATESKLTKYWGEKGKNWKHIEKIVYEIDYFHKPYINTWLELEKIDNMKRLYTASQILEVLSLDSSLTSKIKEKITEKSRTGEQRLFFLYITTIASLNHILC